MYMYTWKKGLKTTYYLRSRPATSISKVTVNHNNSAVVNPKEGGGEGVQKLS